MFITLMITKELPQFGIIAILGDLLSINRKLIEDVQTRLKKLELNK